MKTLVILSQYKVVPQGDGAATPCQGCAFDGGISYSCPEEECDGTIFELITRDEEILEDE